jgi:hypothetical protein
MTKSIFNGSLMLPTYAVKTGDIQEVLRSTIVKIPRDVVEN